MSPPGSLDWRLAQEERLLAEIHAEIDNLNASRKSIWMRGIFIVFIFWLGVLCGWAL